MSLSMNGSTVDPPTSNISYYISSFVLQTDPSIEPDIKWSNLLNHLIAKRAKYETYVAFFSTLGGAYATLKEAPKALRFATSLLRMSIEENDTVLIIRSKVYVALAQLNLGAPIPFIQKVLIELEPQAKETRREEMVGLVQFALMKVEEKKSSLKMKPDSSSRKPNLPTL